MANSSYRAQEIEEKISRDHVQFLVREREECVVRLTEKGKQLYRQIQCMKPLASSVDEDGNYHFECSAFQILPVLFQIQRKRPNPGTGLPAEANL